MTPENFKSWIQGYFDLTTEELSVKQLNIKLNLVKISDALAFCYYLQGYFELATDKLGKWDIEVKNHLQLVFKKVTPNIKEKTLQESLDEYYKDYNKFKPTTTSPPYTLELPTKPPFIAYC